MENRQPISEFPSLMFGQSSAALSASLARMPRGVKNMLWQGMRNRFRRLRRAAGLSFLEISRRAELAEGVPNRLEEQATVPAIDVCERLAAALGVAPGWLAYGPEGNEPFQQRRSRQPLPPDDPPSTESCRVFRQRYQGVASRVRGAREATGRSMRALAVAAGISVQTWSNAEAGASAPKIDSLERMAIALDVAPAWLAYGDDDAS